MEDEDLFEKAANAADELYNIRDTYFPTDPNEKLSKLKSNLILLSNSSIPSLLVQFSSMGKNCRLAMKFHAF